MKCLSKNVRTETVPYQPLRAKSPMIASTRLQTILNAGQIAVSELTPPRHYNVRPFVEAIATIHILRTYRRMFSGDVITPRHSLHWGHSWFPCMYPWRLHKSDCRISRTATMRLSFGLKGRKLGNCKLVGPDNLMPVNTWHKTYLTRKKKWNE